MKPENDRRLPASSDEQRFRNDVRNFAQQVIGRRISIYDLKFKRATDDPEKLIAAIRKELYGSRGVPESENDWDNYSFDI